MKTLLFLLAVASTSFATTSPELLQNKISINNETNFMDQIRAITTFDKPSNNVIRYSANEIREILHKEAKNLNLGVINKVIATLNCVDEQNVAHNNILTIIDYSLPSSEKRLWVFDLNEKKLLFNTYVSHGLKSGTLLTQFFSNKFNSKASSIGVFKTEQMYNGRHGLSLRLDGLEAGFNDNASNRSVVMHGGWYVEENFIKKYGRAGRSWGCPAVPDNLTRSIINTIKENSIFVVYYPDDKWLARSKFLNCPSIMITRAEIPPFVEHPIAIPNEGIEQRDDVVFVGSHRNQFNPERGTIVVMSADNYEQTFHTKPPLNRMLRRQINQAEYIALSNAEFRSLVSDEASALTNINKIYFVVPELRMTHGYYATDLKMVNLGKIHHVKSNAILPNSFTVYFETNRFVNIDTTNQFIRWLGL